MLRCHLSTTFSVYFREFQRDFFSLSQCGLLVPRNCGRLRSHKKSFETSRSNKLQTATPEIKSNATLTRRKDQLASKQCPLAWSSRPTRLEVSACVPCCLGVRACARARSMANSNNLHSCGAGRPTDRPTF